jgi:hypothetical protein
LKVNRQYSKHQTEEQNLEHCQKRGKMLITSAWATTFFIFAFFLEVFYQHTITAANLQESASINREDDEILDNIVSDSAAEVSCQFNVFL